MKSLKDILKYFLERIFSEIKTIKDELNNSIEEKMPPLGSITKEYLSDELYDSIPSISETFNTKYTQEFKDTLSKQNALKLSEELNSDIYTIEDIIKELLNPGLDPRDELEAPILKSDILHLEDLKVGMELQGTVRNVASFGAFIDIGLHDDGLVHISKMSKSFVKNPNDVVHVGDIVTCYVSDIDLTKQKVQLSLIKNA